MTRFFAALRMTLLSKWGFAIACKVLGLEKPKEARVAIYFAYPNLVLVGKRF
jgi:hypothetical protein